jgi:LmbE family N-acetylglucosaminyl deacetylase
MNDTLVVAVQPEDETLGCGGTLLRCKAEGHSIHWLLLTSMTREYGFPDDKCIAQTQVMQAVENAYGFFFSSYSGISPPCGWTKSL